MARTLIRGNESVAYQQLAPETQRLIERQQRQAQKFGAFFVVEDEELVLYYPGPDLGEGTEQRQLLEGINPRIFTPTLNEVEKRLRMQWMPKYEHLHGLLEYLGLALVAKHDEVVVIDEQASKQKQIYYYMKIGTQEYPGFERLVTDLAEKALLTASHIQVEIRKTSVCIEE